MNIRNIVALANVSSGSVGEAGDQCQCSCDCDPGQQCDKITHTCRSTPWTGGEIVPCGSVGYSAPADSGSSDNSTMWKVLAVVTGIAAVGAVIAAARWQSRVERGAGMRNPAPRKLNWHSDPSGFVPHERTYGALVRGASYHITPKAAGGYHLTRFADGIGQSFDLGEFGTVEAAKYAAEDHAQFERSQRRGKRNPTQRGLARRARAEGNLDKLVELVDRHAKSETPVLRGGEIIGRGKSQITVTKVGTHTVQYKTGDGYTGAIQIPFIGSDGETLPSHGRVLVEAYAWDYEP